MSFGKARRLRRAFLLAASGVAGTSPDRYGRPPRLGSPASAAAGPDRIVKVFLAEPVKINDKFPLRVFRNPER